MYNYISIQNIVNKYDLFNLLVYDKNAYHHEITQLVVYFSCYYNCNKDEIYQYIIIVFDHPYTQLHPMSDDLYLLSNNN